MKDGMDKKLLEAELALETLMCSAALEVTDLRAVWLRDPLNRTEQERALARAGEALGLAAAEPGTVVKLSCPRASELVFVAGALIKYHSEVGLELLRDESSATHLEFTNNSAIYVVPGKGR